MKEREEKGKSVCTVVNLLYLIMCVIIVGRDTNKKLVYKSGLQAYEIYYIRGEVENDKWK